MIYKAYSTDSAKFLSLPETGMGYQLVSSKVYGQDVARKFVIFNSELIFEIDSDFQNNRRKLYLYGYKASLNDAKLLNFQTNTIQLIPRSLVLEGRSLSDSKKEKYRRHSGGRGALDNPKELANGSEIFVRLSAYEDDKRIDQINNCLRPGSFTTTNQDYIDCVTTSDDPVDRYALPNDETIKWAFYILPKKSIDELQRGIAQPAHGHDGGGIEAYFEAGTSKDTYYQKKIYGKLN